MVYTHYVTTFPDKKSNILYQKLLGVIHGSDGRLLIDILKEHIDKRNNTIKTSELFEKNFYEVELDLENNPVLGKYLLRTDRKVHDLAVAVAYAYLVHKTRAQHLYDSKLDHLHQLASHMRQGEYDKFYKTLNNYVRCEGIKIYDKNDLDMVVNVLQQFLFDTKKKKGKK